MIPLYGKIFKCFFEILRGIYEKMTAEAFCGHSHIKASSAFEHFFGVISLVGVCILLNILSRYPLGDHSVKII